MKRVCLFLLVSICLTGYGQTPDTANKKGFKPRLIPDATTAKKIIEQKDTSRRDTNYPKTEEPQVRDQSSRNIDAIIQLQKENRARQKRNAIIRIGIGLVLLVVLVVGLSRRRKTK